MGLFRKTLAFSFILFFCCNVFAKDTKIPQKSTSAAVKKTVSKPVAKKATPVKKTTTTPAKKVTPKPTTSKAAVKPAVKKAVPAKKVTPKPAASKAAVKPAAKKVTTANKTVSKATTPAKKVTPKPAASKPAVKPVAKKVTTANKTVSKTTTPVKKVTPKPAVSKTAVKPAAKKVTTANKTVSKASTPVKKTTTIKSVKKESYKNDKLIILDAGHGGYDLGCRLSSCNEKSLALSTTLMIKKYLNNMGYRVLLTRSRDIFISLKRRTEIANETKSKLFVSIHYNAAKNTDAKGIEVFYYKSKDKWRTGSSKKLAVRVLSKLIDRTGAKNRGVKDGNFFVIRETNMPAVLIEGGFITHENERSLLKDSGYREKIARGIAEGIDSYFKA